MGINRRLLTALALSGMAIPPGMMRAPPPPAPPPDEDDDSPYPPTYRYGHWEKINTRWLTDVDRYYLDRAMAKRARKNAARLAVVQREQSRG